MIVILQAIMVAKPIITPVVIIVVVELLILP